MSVKNKVWMEEKINVLSTNYSICASTTFGYNKVNYS